jgi:hypothetical protein
MRFIRKTYLQILISEILGYDAEGVDYFNISHLKSRDLPRIEVKGFFQGFVPQRFCLGGVAVFPYQFHYPDISLIFEVTSPASHTECSRIEIAIFPGFFRETPSSCRGFSTDGPLSTSISRSISPSIVQRSPFSSDQDQLQDQLEVPSLPPRARDLSARGACGGNILRLLS